MSQITWWFRLLLEGGARAQAALATPHLMAVFGQRRRSWRTASTGRTRSWKQARGLGGCSSLLLQPSLTQMLETVGIRTVKMQILCEGTAAHRDSEAPASFLNSSFSLGSPVRTKKMRPDWLLLMLSVSLSRLSQSRDATSIRADGGFIQTIFTTGGHKLGKSRLCHAERALLGWRKTAIIIAFQRKP